MSWMSRETAPLHLLFDAATKGPWYGFEVIAHMERTAPERLYESVIVLTALSRTDLGLLEGKPLFRVILKPFHLDDVVSAVEECCRRRDAARDIGEAPAPA